ncbi:hypothetical protein [Sorangium sp. So ce542]|uniref:hypothetical protein n=1 Tax=Sorangium sp. So ce542 TaxID=3133316 RepID=UPI003F5FFA5E
MSLDFPFRFSRSDVALIVELYLPKRAQYQALLLQILSCWYEWERQRSSMAMKDHFKDNKHRILELVEHYSSLRSAYDTLVESFPLGLAVGHSVYEVDGFFANADTPAVAQWAKAMFAGGSQAATRSIVTQATDVSRHFAAEERTLVVRFIFPFPERTLVDQAAESFAGKAGLKPIFREAIRGFLQTPSEHRPNEYIKRLLTDASYKAALKEYSGERLSDAEEHVGTLVKIADSWIHFVALWLFGYLVLKVTSGMNDLVVQGELAKNEDEIWITSFWDVALNRIVPTNKPIE